MAVKRERRRERSGGAMMNGEDEAGRGKRGEMRKGKEEGYGVKER